MIYIPVIIYNVITKKVILSLEMKAKFISTFPFPIQKFPKKKLDKKNTFVTNYFIIDWVILYAIISEFEVFFHRFGEKIQIHAINSETNFLFKVL